MPIDFHAIAPELVLAGTALLVLVVDLFVERAKVVASWLSIAGTVAAGVALASLVGGGMATLMPRLAGVFTLACIASLGLPGLAGFWGEILALLAAWNPAAGLSVPLFRTLAAVGLLGTLLTAGYFLWLIQRVNLGRVPDRWGSRALGDLAPIEVAAWSPLIVLIVALGFVPGLVLWLTSPSVTGWFTELFTLART